MISYVSKKYGKIRRAAMATPLQPNPLVSPLFENSDMFTKNKAKQSLPVYPTSVFLLSLIELNRKKLRILQPE